MSRRRRGQGNEAGVNKKEEQEVEDGMALTQNLKNLGNSNFPLVPFDIFFTFEVENPEENNNKTSLLRIGAHKFILALGSDVYKQQFYGRMKETRKEIEIVDSSFDMYRLFVKMFYEDVDISCLNIASLSELFYLGDKYDVKELRDEVIATLTGLADTEDDPLLAVEAAVLGYSNKILPELSEALFQRSIKILKGSVSSGSNQEVEVVKLFAEMGSCYATGAVIDEVLGSIMSRLELASLCPNCHRSPADCLDKTHLTLDNFVEGALVRLSGEVRFCLPNSQSTVTIGNPAVYKLGTLSNDGMFSSFSESGSPLQLSKLYSSTYIYNCSQRL